MAAATEFTLDSQWSGDSSAFTGESRAPCVTLRSTPAANSAGGAALLAAYQEALVDRRGARVTPRPGTARWPVTAARTGADAAAAFADEVFATMRAGATRVTDDGHRVSLAARDVAPARSWLSRLGLRKLARTDGLECPTDISCDWIPAPYADFGGGDYCNHDKGSPKSF